MAAIHEFQQKLQAARAGDADVLGELLMIVTPAVRRAVQADLPQRWQHLLAVDDVLQQTCVDVFCDIAQFAGENEPAFGRWLMRIARRNLIDAVRMLDAEKRGRGRQRVSRDDEAALDLLLAVTGRTRVSQAATRQEISATLHRAVEALPGQYRQVITEYDLRSREMAEIAAELQRSAGAAYMLRARALRLLRKTLGGSTGYFSESS